MRLIASSMSASPTSATTFSTLKLLKSASWIAGTTSIATVYLRSDLPARRSSTSVFSVGMVIFGSVARRKPRSVKIWVLASRMVWSMVSAMTERPYTFFRWLTGTLPGRKPLRRTLSFMSTRRASALASRSEAGTLTWNSCFNPCETVSVTCMAKNLLPLRRGARGGPENSRFCQAHGLRLAPVLSANRSPREDEGSPVIPDANAKRRLVRAEGLEPPQLSSLEPKSSASTSSATPASLAAAVRGRRLITWASPFAAKKWPISAALARAAATGHRTSKMVRIGFMARDFLRMDRRALVAGFGATSLGLLLPGGSAAQGPPPVAIKAREGTLNLRPGSPETPVWMLTAPDLRFRRGDDLQVQFANDLAVPVGLDWRGIDGVPSIELLISRRLLAPAGWEKVRIPLRHAGTFLCDMGVLANQN